MTRLNDKINWGIILENLYRFSPFTIAGFVQNDRRKIVRLYLILNACCRHPNDWIQPIFITYSRVRRTNELRDRISARLMRSRFVLGPQYKRRSICYMYHSLARPDIISSRPLTRFPMPTPTHFRFAATVSVTRDSQPSSSHWPPAIVESIARVELSLKPLSTLPAGVT